MSEVPLYQLFELMVYRDRVRDRQRERGRESAWDSSPWYQQFERHRFAETQREADLEARRLERERLPQIHVVPAVRVCERGRET